MTKKIVGIDPVIIKASEMGYDLYHVADTQPFTVMKDGVTLMYSYNIVEVVEFLEKKVNG